MGGEETGMTLTNDPALVDLGLHAFSEQIQSVELRRAWPTLLELGRHRLRNHGRFAEWEATISSLPQVSDLTRRLNQDAPQVTSTRTVEGLAAVLLKLGPWKKGPFDILGTHIDAEWRSNLKWRRVQEYASPLCDRTVLDVGTGNGYFLLRAAGDGARAVLGLEPSVHYVAQFLALQRYFSCSPIALLPATSEEFVEGCAAFDTVLSMGVLYHRRSPLDHLHSLRGFVKSGGELVLETIVVEGPLGYSLVPEGRYAQMRNVWFLPSVLTLESWLRRTGMIHIRSSPVVTTTTDEQRSTEWTGPPSLGDFLDPEDPRKTIEGYPAPQRVIVVSQAP
jgi:tRNA (mo5U34)-methyltransferase